MLLKRFCLKYIFKSFFKPSDEINTVGEHWTAQHIILTHIGLAYRYLVFLIVYSIILCILYTALSFAYLKYIVVPSTYKYQPFNFFLTCLRFQNHFRQKNIVFIYISCTTFWFVVQLTISCVGTVNLFISKNK